MSTTSRIVARPLRRLRTGSLIREARQKAGLTQSELASRLGTRQSVVSRWEHGAEEPRLSTLDRILRACGFSAELSLRAHDDVDRSQLALHLAMSPAQRVRHHRSAVKAVDRAQRARIVT